MTFPKARLAVSLCLFLAWLGFLGYLVYESSPVNLSHAQFAVADAVVIAEVRDNGGQAVPEVTVREVAWCADWHDRASLRGKLQLPELMSCNAKQGYVGPDVYILPLHKVNSFFVVAPVRTPGPNLEALRTPSHGTLHIFDAGDRPERVLERLIQYARAKPQVAQGLLKPLEKSIAECVAARLLRPDVEPQMIITEVDLPRRLPIDDAERLAKELRGLDAKVQLRAEELRIYSATARTRGQLNAIIAAKSK